MRNFLKKRCRSDKMSREKYLTARALRIFHIDICAIYQIEREKHVMLIRKNYVFESTVLSMWTQMVQSLYIHCEISDRVILLSYIWIFILEMENFVRKE